MLATLSTERQVLTRVQKSFIRSIKILSCEYYGLAYNLSQGFNFSCDVEKDEDSNNYTLYLQYFWRHPCLGFTQFACFLASTPQATKNTFDVLYVSCSVVSRSMSGLVPIISQKPVGSINTRKDIDNLTYRLGYELVEIYNSHDLAKRSLLL